MMKKIVPQFILITLILAGCSQLIDGLPKPSDFGIPTYVLSDPALVELEVAQTVAAIQTQSSAETQAVPVVTAEPYQVVFATAIPTLEQVPIDEQKPVDIALLLGVLSVQDGTEIFPTEAFDRIWRVRNAGETTWNSDYALVFVSGEAMGAPEEIPLSTQVAPGEMVDIRLHLTAPEELGEISALWALQNPAGETIGMGGDGKGQLSVTIEVVENPISSPFRQVMRFYQGFSQAEWYDQNGNSLCEADGNVGPAGFVYRENNPHFQNGIVENEPALVMIPAEGPDGFIAGKFPPFNVRAGDYFVARVGCLVEGTLCDVTFKLAYQIVGEEEITVYTEIRNTANDQWVEIRKNLTQISGQEVQFLLIVENNQLSKGDFAAWFAPAILR